MTFRSARLAGPVLLLLAALVSAPAAQAQKYRTAVGLRLGKDNYGLTVQQKIFEKTTLEGLALVSPREVSGTVLAERHFGILGPSLNYYLGAGAHVGNHKDDGAFGGFDALAGVEYKTAFFPFVLSFDIKPTVEINSADWARFPAAFSVRYVLIKEKKTGLFNGLFGSGKDREKDKEKPRKERKSEEKPRRGLFDF
ncbi:hypothetical protein SAMN02745146_0633 [Hymenobacter daecheongensis DSM 21074]|uniref:Outer membrane protein beta-barrel domain-containing protein n=1 Tax=Hymenobacter daecheongensis DSM 21074 TaxID=1121955 RepID=A0A1M6AH78_9BACT|nr:hypothetical protein [Hymenobacter daecheongensis]SHI35668.1 hypothetical protein SAMN02745146_0633 [Hymenobacter daecheongensis DSM 21074]